MPVSSPLDALTHDLRIVRASEMVEYIVGMVQYPAGMIRYLDISECRDLLISLFID